MQHGLGDVAGVDRDLQRVALAVVLVELLGLEVVRRRALLAPRRAPDLRALQDGVRVDGVDPDAVAAALLGQAAREVQLGGLRGRVRGGVLARHERVLGGDEDDRAAAVLRLEDPEGLARDQEVAGAEDRVVAVPLGQRGLLDRGAGGDAGVGDDDVDPAELARPPPRRPRATAVLGGHVAGDGQPAVAVLGDRLARAVAVEVERHHARAGGGQRGDDRAPDPARAAGDQRDLALQLAGRRRLRELVELERPVLDREALGGVQGHELAQAPQRRPSPRSRGGRGRARSSPPWSSSRWRPGPCPRRARSAGRDRPGTSPSPACASKYAR